MSDDPELESKKTGLARLTQLQPADLRVLGVLLEKEQSTPEYYPMTLNAIAAGCNQKTSREPVMSLSGQEVLNVLRVLAQEGFVTRETGPRADRWSHKVDPLLRFQPAPKAVLTVLLLRGAQTPGEIRSRCERMHSFASTHEVDEILEALAGGEDALVRQLPRQPGQKEERWDLRRESAVYEAAAPAAPAAGDAGPYPFEERLRSLEERVEILEAEVRKLSGN